MPPTDVLVFIVVAAAEIELMFVDAARSTDRGRRQGSTED